jgi:hypothetical protein
MLEDWSAEDVAAFTAYLSRFGDSLEASRATVTARPQGGAPTHQLQEN